MSQMINLLRAEWTKTVLNYKLTGFLVWISPVGMGAYYAVMLFGGLFSRRFAENMLAIGTGQWTSDALVVWGSITTFPINTMGRMLPLAFMAVVSASEYQYGMWKNLVPRAGRTPLLLSKIGVLLTVLLLSFGLTSVIIVLGQSLGHQMFRLEYGPALTGAELFDFMLDYVQTILLSLASLLILAGGAAQAAIITRSILGCLLIGFGLSVFDAASMVLLRFVGYLLGKPDVINLYQLTPSYNLDNAAA